MFSGSGHLDAEGHLELAEVIVEERDLGLLHLRRHRLCALCS